MSGVPRPSVRIPLRAAPLAVSALVPIVLLLTNVRLLLTPAFVSLEYSTPGFPPDGYGFSQGDRVKWAQLARVYLLNDAGPAFLGELRDQNGNPLYSEREVQHMLDVKALVQTALKAWLVSLALLGMVGALAWRLGGSGTLRRGLRDGARLTLFLMGALVILLLVSFSALFTGFHEIFFKSGTWLFSYSDTLIRLFPIRFWRDVFALWMLLTVGEAALLQWATRPSSSTPTIGNAASADEDRPADDPAS